MGIGNSVHLRHLVNFQVQKKNLLQYLKINIVLVPAGDKEEKFTKDSLCKG